MKKSLYSVEEAVTVAWDHMPQTFYAINLINFVKSYIGRPMAYDGTILRKLRVLRQKDPLKYGYKCIDKETSQYKKTAA